MNSNKNEKINKLKNGQEGDEMSKNKEQKPAINDLLFKYFLKLDKEASKRGFTEYGGSDNEKESENKYILGSPVLNKKNKKIQKQEIY
ncbi:hypothetical protein DICPUDRAFT_156757 [Dictyostelium purpureum]|uniref:Uncharacterized protein n=1 Tax=Dictyostelium purpureum TaxID=5786 RepID=F0ZXC8_DICPU|nr:uncharacterized protein DICPUDRAFT_156757 [Dictyostelium purpureum]EGC31408.1 hypothetical protein DICPUDRAFT_156757 [Dictyostelium purpureum]|eukprot:XP_003292078.1 hypothetical protein DICPUDRAFT_156757 [Dictyostelium purpureum]